MLSDNKRVLPAGSTILVTGVSGFIGSHVADQLLSAGYLVRGTTRDPTKSSWLPTFFDNKYGKGKFDLITVVDTAEAGAFDSALEGVSGVIHVASDMTFGPDPNLVITPTVASTLNILRAAAEHASVKRVVLTSSCASAASPGLVRAIEVDSWNDEAISQAWAPPPYEPSRGFSVYAASKAQSEKEAWKWYEESKPGFVLNAVLPSMNFGKSLDPVSQGHPSTSGLIQGVFHNDVETVSNNGAQYFFIDVQDNALLHVAALLHPDIRQERIFAYAAPYTWRGVQKVVQGLYPERPLGPEFPDAEPDASTIVPAPRAEFLLKEMGRDGWTSLEECVKLNTEDLV
ncbi:related to flavonol reductase/cinnamoyl-CoA reductase [Cephalotrichum gorgonifer]|uniref:Related to flavonol reductase/cinnamoyl-CoA reductase n=1 Tax=Cephalotrichum gorgonifer TaxID=2041049 RepID=A0AAE8MWK1_9PEZI|nr:related to flavonol reductase/cinnamoyl-CoA reductase [Cephalotrichum gorgonifer]